NSRPLMGMVATDMAQHKPDAALQLLQAESKKAPNRLDLLVGLANTSAEAGRYDESVGYYQRVLDGMDKNSRSRGEIYLRMGDAYRLKGDDNNAIATLQKARTALPENENVLISLALTLDKAGRRPEAQK